jgi:adenylate cyclase
MGPEEWLMLQPSEPRSPQQLLTGYGEALNAVGIPVWRISTSLHNFDPTLDGVQYRWTQGTVATATERPPLQLTGPIFQNTPAQAALVNNEETQCRLDVPIDQLPYPILAELKEAGGTGYLCLPMSLTEALAAARHAFGRDLSWISYATNIRGGWAEAHVRRLRALSELLALRLSLENSKRSAVELLRAYLGSNAAEHVLAGAFRRGSSRTISAVIWYCDMRGFTAMSDRTPPDEVVRVLDRYFECVATPIESRGGEVLKFIGDAVLGIFPVGAEGPRAPCLAAIEATREVRSTLERHNLERTAGGDPALGCGIALHVGEVMYGNIGSQRRFDFTVIGAPVNEVCRVEPLTRTLGVDVLMTARFVQAAELEEARSMGRHALKGVGETHEVFALP